MYGEKQRKKKNTQQKENVTIISSINKHNDERNLIIVESPSKCKTIEKYMGSQYKCIATKGHLREINGLKSINKKNNYEITYSIIKEKEGHIRSIQSIISEYNISNIYLGTDDDREGEAIAWHICELFNLPIETTKRIIFHEVTKPAIENAVKNPITINMNLVYSQQARQVLDIIVGFKISPYLWKYIYSSKSKSLSAGRCQTPALRLIYDNDIEKRTGEEQQLKYKIIGYFFSKNLPFILNTEFDTETEVLSFLEKSKTTNYKLEINKTPHECVIAPPLPLHTSRLLQISNNQLNMSPKQTMSYCQQLYQEGYITYMRTTSTKYSKVFLEKTKDYIEKRWKIEYVGNIEKLEHKDSNDPHEAIRVTNIEHTTIDCDDTKLKSLYNLIWRNTIESCMANEIKKVTNIKIVEEDHNHNHNTKEKEKKYEYKYALEIPLFAGWRIITKKIEEITTETNEKNGILMYLQMIEKSSNKIIYNTINALITFHEKHSYYTEAGLIKKLEELGIGRPSTYAMLVETIKERGYVTKMNVDGTKYILNEYILSNNEIEKTTKEKIFGGERNKLIIQPIGILTIEFLLKYFQSLFSYEYTKKMEEELDEISLPLSNEIENNKKQKEWFHICKNCDDEIKEHIKPLSKLGKQSYKINEEYELVFQQYGPVLKNKNNEYKSIKKNIELDIEKLKNGLYNYDDLVEIKNNVLGEYNDEPIYIKSGKYGAYIEYKDTKKNISKINNDMSKITLEDAIGVLTDDKRYIVQSKNTLRIIDTDMSIKKGKYGSYVYYKTDVMKTPEFYSLSKFKLGYLKCDIEILKKWILETYNVPKINEK
jgi:DNA topoisomerase-1